MHRLSPRVSIVFGLLALIACVGVASERSASMMATAAIRLLDSLSPDQRQKAALSFDTDERFRWNYIPTEMFARRGLTLKDMTEPQRGLAHDLLKTGLSERGYFTATSIMNLETVLKTLEQGQFRRDPTEYYFSIFGTPSTRGSWGWRVDGHHVTVQFTIVDGSAIANAPSFFGSNPAEVREGPKKGLRILGTEEDAARALLVTLDGSQRALAVINNVAPNDIVTTNALKVDPLSPVGIKATALTSQQRDLLMQLVQIYTSWMADDIAAERIARLLKAGVDNIAFAWAGEIERGKKHYYRIQGPTFLVEYDNTQDDGNHIHSVWRDFDGDFGRDLLRDHLKSVAH